MKISTKTTFIIFGTLTIGIVIGFLGGGLVHKIRFERFEDMRKMNPENRFEQMIDEIINPNDNQRELLKGLLNNQAKRIAQLDEEYHSKILSVFDSTRQEIRSNLTEEQIQRLEQQIKQGRNEFRQKHLERLSQMLQLSDEQKTKIEKIMEEFEKTFNKDRGLPFNKPEPDGDRFKENFDEMNAKIKSVLTPEQYQKYEQFEINRDRNKRMPPPGGPGDRRPPFMEKPPNKDLK